MAGTCTVYKSRNFGPRWSGTKELAAYFTTDAGEGLGSETVGTGGATIYSVLIDPYASVKTQTADADADLIILNMDKYTNVSVYIANVDSGQTLTAQVWSCPPQPTPSDRDTAAAVITTATTLRLEAAATVAANGWVQEGGDITVSDGTVSLSKLTATGGMLAVAVKSPAALGAGHSIRVYVVGEFA